MGAMPIPGPGGGGAPDVQALQARSMVDRLSQLAPQQGGASPDAAGMQLSSQMSQLKGADPNLMTKAGEMIKSMLMAMQFRMAFVTPEAARHAMMAQKSLDSMLEALKKASAVTNTVAPIANNAGMTPPGGPQAGGPAGGMGAMPGIGQP